MSRLPVVRRQALQRAADRVVHVFLARPTTGRRRKARWPPRAHLWVRVYVQRKLGNTFDRIETVYGIDARTAKRWEAEGKGQQMVARAVELKLIDFAEIVKDVTGSA